MDEVKTKEEVITVKGAEKEGSLSKEVAGIKETLRLENLVLFVGFIIILVSVGLFIVQAWWGNTESYNTLLNKVDTLQAQLQIQQPISTSTKSIR